MVNDYEAIPWDRHSLVEALLPLVVDIALPIGLYYLLTAEGASSTIALVLGGLIPGARSVLGVIRRGRADPLAAMMAGLFALSLLLLAFTGSPKFLLVKESFGTVLVGLWCLVGARAARPMTFYTARPMLTRGRPEAVQAWERLADTSPEFRRIQRRLSILWGIGLLVEAALRVLIVVHYPVHTAAGLVNVPIVAIIVGLSMLSGPLGAIKLQRLVIDEMKR